MDIFFSSILVAKDINKKFLYMEFTFIRDKYELIGKGRDDITILSGVNHKTSALYFSSKLFTLNFVIPILQCLKLLFLLI